MPFQDHLLSMIAWELEFLESEFLHASVSKDAEAVVAPRREVLQSKILDVRYIQGVVQLAKYSLQEGESFMESLERCKQIKEEHRIIEEGIRQQEKAIRQERIKMESDLHAKLEQKRLKKKQHLEVDSPPLLTVLASRFLVFKGWMSMA